MNIKSLLLLFLALPFCTFTSDSQIILDSIPDTAGYTYWAHPDDGLGPYPGVLYNHGGLGPAVGGDLKQTVIALANAGYYARAEKRDTTFTVMGHLEMVEDALDSVITNPNVDPNCIAIMGFSRGGYLALEAAKQNPDKVHKIILCAPADPAGLLALLVQDVSPIDDPVRILIADNDTLQDPLTAYAQMVHDSLINGGKISSKTVYPGYDSNGDSVVDGTDDGHELFFFVQTPYWPDVIAFLDSTFCEVMSVEDLSEQLNIKVYPNPAESEVFIEIQNKTDQAFNLNLYDHRGVLVLQNENIEDSQFRINRGNLDAGMYFYTVDTGFEVIDRGKLIFR